MKSSHRELFIDMVIHKGIFKSNQNMFFPSFTSISLKKKLSDFCEWLPVLYNLNERQFSGKLTVLGWSPACIRMLLRYQTFHLAFSYQTQ